MKLHHISILALASSIASTSILANPGYASEVRINGNQLPVRTTVFKRTPISRNPVYQQPVAQVFRTTINLPAGQNIMTRLADNQTLVLNNGETKAAKLRVEQDVIANNGTVVIPVGAIINGEFIPVSGGSKFVARTLSSRGATVSMGAESALINDTKDPRETNTGSILTDAAIGAAGAAILSGVLGDRVISTEKILGGAAAGVIVGNTTAPQATVIEPKMSINVTTNRNLTFSQGGN